MKRSSHLHNSKQQPWGFRETDLRCFSTVILQTEWSLRDDRGEKCFPYHQPSGDMMDHSINYRGKDQRCLPRCLLGPVEAAHLDQKTQLHQS